MSRIAELIAKLCPNGIEYVKLEDVCTLVTGATPSKTNPEYWENGTVPWMSSGEVNNKVVYDTESKITQLGYDKTSTTLVPIHTVVIALAGQGKTRGKVAITEIELCTNQSLCSIICGDKINYKFLYHYLDSKYEELREISNGDGTRGGLSLRILKPYTIPLPPLEIQIELVRILDEYSASVTALQQELEKELTARKKQYEYYRDLLLDFDVHEGGTNECEWRTIKEIFDIRNGYTPSKSNVEYWENGIIPWFRMDDIRENGRILSNSIQHIARKGVKKSGIFPANSLIMSTTATIGEHALIKTNFVCNQQITCFSLKQEYSSKINIKFVFYLFFNFGEWCRNNANNGGGLPIINTAKLSTYKIPIPTIEKQKRIVSILDRFDKLCNDISEGLPAEIEARRKQYEYYRDKLLSFKEQ
jgi:restriction modification system DNA specificity domain protein